MTEDMNKGGFKDVLESIDSCAKAASDFSREYKKLSKKFNELETSLEEATEKGIFAGEAVESINKSAENLKLFSDSIPGLAKRLDEINKSIEESQNIFEKSDDKLKEFRENLEKFEEITNSMDKFASLAEKIDPEEMDRSFADNIRKINAIFDRNKSDIVALSNQVAEYKRMLRDMRASIKEFSEGTKGYTSETNRQLSELRKIAEERSEISFHTHIDVEDSLIEEIVGKAAQKLNERIELGDREMKEVLLGDDLVAKIADSSALRLGDTLKGNVYSEQDFRPEIVREVITIMLEREKKKLGKAEERQRESEEDIKRAMDERLNAFKEEILDEIANIKLEAPAPLSKVEITGATLMPELSKLIGMQQDDYLEKIKDFMKVSLPETIEKKLHELNIIPEPEPEIHTLKELREIHGKFPFDVVDHTDAEKTKYQIRKFDGEEAACSVYLAEGKKFKVDYTININERKYLVVKQ